MKTIEMSDRISDPLPTTLFNFVREKNYLRPKENNESMLPLARPRKLGSAEKAPQGSQRFLLPPTRMSASPSQPAPQPGDLATECPELEGTHKQCPVPGPAQDLPKTQTLHPRVLPKHSLSSSWAVCMRKQQMPHTTNGGLVLQTRTIYGSVCPKHCTAVCGSEDRKETM